MMTYSPKAHAIVRKMVASGGWTGMVQAIDTALAQGVAEPFSYAKTVMAGNQAKSRLSMTKPNGAPSFSQPKKLLHGNL